MLDEPEGNSKQGDDRANQDQLDSVAPPHLLAGLAEAVEVVILWKRRLISPPTMDTDGYRGIPFRLHGCLLKLKN
jgi:hypothetical protein